MSISYVSIVCCNVFLSLLCFVSHFLCLFLVTGLLCVVVILFCVIAFCSDVAACCVVWFCFVLFHCVAAFGVVYELGVLCGVFSCGVLRDLVCLVCI